MFAVVLQEQASKVRLVPFGYETLEIYAHTVSLTLYCCALVRSSSSLNCALRPCEERRKLCLYISMLNTSQTGLGLVLAHYALCSYWIVQQILYIFVIVLSMIMAIASCSQQV